MASYSVASLRVVVLESRWWADSEQSGRQAHQFLVAPGKEPRTQASSPALCPSGKGPMEVQSGKRKFPLFYFP